ncbi:MAG: caspase family protein [Oscillatoriaceae cyanobacterium Prado104]|jgi:hypothetical protein|nr:caspase family protein [Oscillatoriaceae cyanobacterium Prado104]
MADQTNQIPKFYALLIGIDHYLPNQLPNGTYYKSLSGCVRDINRVADYLQNTLKVPSQQILRLTAPNPDAPKNSEITDPLPTYENIVAKFKEITEIAQPDEQVYIHYSGHGGRATTIYPELRGADQLDEALVPMDISNSEARYFRDVEFATLLKRMTDKGLVVTVVLDSCHSGGQTRGDSSDIRGLEGEADTTSRSMTESLVASREELSQNWLELTGGTARKAIPGDWLPEVKKYVLLAACRPSEYAYEYAFNGKERNGALTYWLLDTLANGNPELTYKLLSDRIYAKVQSQFQQQTPMLFGEGNRKVFGSDYASSQQYAIPIIKVDSTKNRVLLNAGRAQGLGNGARFAIYPPDVTDFTQKDKQLAIAEVTEDINPGDAWAAIIEPSPPANIPQIEIASQAVMLTAPIALIRQVRLFKKTEGDSKTLELPSQLITIQDEALSKLEVAIATVGKGWVELVSDREAEDYQVALNREGEYEICDRNGTPLYIRPALKPGDSDAADAIVKRLIHLAKYQAALELDNPTALTNKLVVQLTDEHKKPLIDPSNQTLKEEENTFLYIKNESAQNLNVVVLDLQSDWAISQLDILSDGTDFVPLNPNEDLLTPLKFSLPEKYDKAQDILKVFATVRPPKFRWLELPSLDQPIQAKAGIENLRNSHDPLDRLIAAVADVGAELDDLDPIRKAQVNDPKGGWTTKQVTLTVVKA